MSLRTTWRGLDRDVHSPEAARLFARACTRRPEFAGFASLGHVIGALYVCDPETLHAREELLRALLLERREAGPKVWSSALVLAFWPLVSSVAARCPHADIAELALTALLEALDAVSASEPLFALAVRRLTERALFATVRRDRRFAATHLLVGITEFAGSTPSEEAQFLARAAAREPVLELTRRGGSLRAAVSELPEPQRTRRYEALKRKRTRLIKKLRRAA